MKDIYIEAKDLSVKYDSLLAIERVNLNVYKGEILGLIGPNGAGKSTLLKAMVGLISPFEGYVRVLGRDPFKDKKVRKILAYIPQREEVDWDYPVTVLDVVLMGRYPHMKGFKFFCKEDIEIAKEALSAVKMLDYADRRIRDLSGGQQQRVFLARMLAQDPLIYLLDEPLSGLDILTEDLIINILQREKEKGKAIIMSTHHLSTSFKQLDRLALINKRLIALGPPKETLRDELLLEVYGGRPASLHIGDIGRVTY